ncbi:hypothetical protein CHS0354_017420, partial [Potamilus streckersoni]
VVAKSNAYAARVSQDVSRILQKKRAIGQIKLTATFLSRPFIRPARKTLCFFRLILAAIIWPRKTYR